jgi:colanic acid/amylovoran biosynthesis glycosyltransferase
MTTVDQNRAPREVLFLCVTFPAVSETFIFDQMAALRANGASLRIVSLWRERIDRMQKIIGTMKLLEVSRYCLAGRGRFYQAINVLVAFARLVAWRPRTAAALLGLKNKGRSWKDIAWLILFGRHLMHTSSQRLTVANFGMIGRMATDLRRLGLIRGPIVTYFHGFDVISLPKLHGTDYYKDLFQAGDRFLIASPHFRQQLEDIGCPPDRIVYAPVGIDVTAFPWRQDPPPQSRTTFRIVTIARLTEKKGHRYILEAIGKLAAKYPLTYDIIGEGSLLPVLRQQAQALGISEIVRFHGAKLRQDVVALLEQADAFVQASVTTELGDQEAIPVSIKEAMSRGVPVIATWHGGIPHLIRNNQNGLLAAEKDADDLACQIERLIKDRSLGQSLAKEARETIVREWDNAVLMPNFVDMVSSV